ncbi:MAG: hypothetical protein RSC99_06990, partial [Clostridiales bacterium]
KSDIRQNPFIVTAYVHLSTLHVPDSVSFAESKPFFKACIRMKSDIRQNPFTVTAYVHLSTLHSRRSGSFTESKPFFKARHLAKKLCFLTSCFYLYWFRY